MTLGGWVFFHFKTFVLESIESFNTLVYFDLSFLLCDRGSKVGQKVTVFDLNPLSFIASQVPKVGYQESGYIGMDIVDEEISIAINTYNFFPSQVGLVFFFFPAKYVNLLNLAAFIRVFLQSV